MQNADISAWSSLLAYAIDMGGKNHVHASEVLEAIATHIDQQRIISFVFFHRSIYPLLWLTLFPRFDCALRVADCLIETLQKCIESCTELPLDLIDLVHEVLLASYPPKPRNKVDANWLLRSLRTCINNCPTNLVIELLERFHDALSAWFLDECAVFSSEEYSDEIIPLFQTVVIALQSLPPSPQVVHSFSVLFASALQTEPETGELSGDRNEALTAFTDFWNNNCLAFEPPCGKWPDGILHALSVAFPSNPLTVSPETVSMESDHIEAPSITDGYIEFDSDEDDELDVLPRISTPRRHASDQNPSPPSYSTHDVFTLPPTPKKSSRYLEFADGPRLPGLFSSLPSSENTLSRNSRTSSQQSRSVSGSSTGSDDTDKENIGPLVRTGTGMVHYGTKRGTIDPDSSPLGVKRLRTHSYGSDDGQDASAVEAALQIEDDLRPAERVPFGSVNVNAHKTPTKRARKSVAPSLGIMKAPHRSSTSKLQKARNNVKANRSAGRSAASTGDDDTDDGEYLPSSSELESEEEDYGPSSSSSPVGPFTPRAARRVEHAVAIAQDTESDNVVTSSSPTRNIRRMARAGRLGWSSKTYGRKMDPPSALPPAARYLTWSMPN